jgi:hypothetical protein
MKKRPPHNCESAWQVLVDRDMNTILCCLPAPGTVTLRRRERRGDSVRRCHLIMGASSRLQQCLGYQVLDDRHTCKFWCYLTAPVAGASRRG